ncbi:hypothetical protein CERSUDRAFT_114656 [Gelatoporia subvermispora B]|uniref:Protein YOP1 n=1 Tax=Ceriporiopsis subvermispora (strain B) TaxID=914234 RepID=M2QX91_CERS8|nr:hypothetical protein CERSUDRAFT_114656 [Gelatoporia subvermispora B]
MFFNFTLRVISATAAFLYPGYASYKTLSQRPASEEDLERWLRYWSVLGCIVAVEYVAEWLVSWLPLYHSFKTLFLLYLALPAGSGGSYIYSSYLLPLLSTHERQIDSFLSQTRTALYTYAQRALRTAWAHIAGVLNQQGPRGLGAEAEPTLEEANTHTGAAPSLGDPMSGPTQLAQGLWRNYGPGILVGGAALLRQAQYATAAGLAQAQGAAAGRSGTAASPDRDTRRRQLEAELASLSGYDVSGAETPAGDAAPIPAANNPARPSSSSDSLRPRSSSGNSGTGSGRGAFEEVEVPSDIEPDQGVGHPVERPQMQQKRTSWFGWGSTKDYERVKNE